MIRRKLISETVNALLNSAGITQPGFDIKRLAELQGAIVLEEPNEESTSGFLFRTSGSPPIIGINRNHPPTRKRFTTAHELGHLLLHSKSGVHIDYAVVKMRDAKTSEGVNEEEIEANRFAAELLMPQSMLERDLALTGPVQVDDEKVIGRLAKQYGVSQQAMTIRLTSLGLLSI